LPNATTPPFTERVVVIGGGAAGTLTAAHILRAAGPEPIEVSLLDRGDSFGPGVAYATASPLHLLNVPACRMGGIAGRPEHFLEWLRGRGEEVDPAAFVARGLFGSYLVDLLEAAAREADRARLVRRRGDAVGVSRTSAAGAPLAVELDTGERLEADHVVLAVGPLPGPAPFPVPPDLPSSAFVADPWAPGALPSAGGDSILIVGTGLSMVDVALSLAGGSDRPSLRAVSRHGLLPRIHRSGLTRLDCFREPPTDGGLDSLLAAFFADVTRAGETGGDWRDVIDSMRPFAPGLWRQLRVAEKRRFLTTMHRPWDVHRFRMAPQIATRLDDLRREGRLRVGAGTVRELVAVGERVEAVIETADGRRESLIVDRIVNCAGAGTDISRQAPPPIAGMLADGIARPDPLGLGLDVDPEGALVDSAGRSSTRIHVVGALRLGVDWETIGVTEIRDQAAAVARRVVASGRA
jgi:uncharacterized NAD(P)/FAD-binding protein YdhS